MKHSKLLVALISILPLASFAANDKGYYAGAGLGLTEINSSIEFLEGEANDPEAGYKFFAGYDFNPNWSAEIGYTQYGDADSTLIYEGFDATVNFETASIYLAGLYHWNFAERWSFDFALNMQRVKGKTSVEGELCDAVQSLGAPCSSDDTAWGIGAGLGTTWSITERLNLRGTVDINKLKFDDDGQDIGGNLESDDLFEIPWRLGVDLYWKF